MNKAARNYAFLFVLTLLVFSVSIFGQIEGNPENWCRNGFFARESSDYKLAKIKGKTGEKIYFYGDDGDCPNGKNCRRKSYLMAGDEVIVSRTFGNWACSWFQPKKGSETVGWISLENIDYLEKSKITISDWIGAWKYYDNSINIVISKNPGFLDITGNAIWKGLGDNVHIGELDDSSKPVGNQLKIGENETGEYDCRVTIRLVGRFLVVSDNLHCGGANVTFSGVYQK
jgi:hypothetical protein